MLVSTMFAGYGGQNIQRGYRLHITNLEDRVFTYTVRYWVTPPSSKARWAEILNRSFILYTRRDESAESGELYTDRGEVPLFRRTDTGAYTASTSVLVRPNHTVRWNLLPLLPPKSF